MLPRENTYSMQDMVMGMMFHQTEDTFQFGSPFGWEKRESPQKSRSVAVYRINVDKWRIRPVLLEGKGLQLHTDLRWHRQISAATTNRFSIAVKNQPLWQETSTFPASLGSSTVGFEELVSTVYVFYIWSSLQTNCSVLLCTEAPGGSQSAWSRPCVYCCSLNWLHNMCNSCVNIKGCRVQENRSAVQIEQKG